VTSPNPNPQPTPARPAYPTRRPEPERPVPPPRPTRSRPRVTDEVEAWASALAATLPPFTPAEAAAVGQLAAALDERPASSAAAA
jgi:hypothetical protein